ncbi:Uncharacterised protein [Mycolicibacterium flavescens]|uniref:hypothetical protein n=1 Tax=Mycobacterium TaxID=1763 RepID=UPI0007FEEB79|nr:MULTISPECIES: hypothetical protein [Mycobacterium]OBF97257.1 hypothetical protein A5790_00800 [Mycobacterium sp. 852002-51152_SCH6134967]VEG42617.1 Uncharacterised protein [Mycolicibacterium flavescens]
MDASVDCVSCYFAEWYLANLTQDAVERLVTRLQAALENSDGEFSVVRLVGAVAVPEDEVFYGVFAATSPESVTEVCERIGMPPGRLTASVGAWFASA